ncbi:preprotein translocase subunit SecA [Candidatus Jidaibacter acanthamoebae]|nr:preprotein translocase subunit SecA [Candidatus Jidaibacter acanthamoeba]
MFSYFAKKLFGSSNDRFVKSLYPVVAKINSLESIFEKLSNDELKAKTFEFKEQLKAGRTLDDLLPEAFAAVREASKRTQGKRHFDVQLIGGIVLNNGMIAEMKTGEGKTLVSTLPAYLNALTGKGVHIITVNDYLVERDSKSMGEIYNFLGLSVGSITNSIPDWVRKKAYEADITYGTNNEFGFDYLRDNLKLDLEEMVQRPFNYAIVDEVDSILIDESRTPLIISGPTEDNSDLYYKINKLIPLLGEGDYETDEKGKNCALSDKGHETIEQLLKDHKIISKDAELYNIENMGIVHHVNQGLRAHKIFQKDVDYIIKDNKVMIIDEFTGRVLDGRRYSEGLHQALEAKENVQIQNENQTLASITFQNYFRMYPKLAGMTGTAMTEANEFIDIYKLPVFSIPTHLEVKRKDEEDVIYKSMREKYDAIIEEIEASHKHGQPILVGTVSIEKSEYLSSLLKKRKIKHNVLNARQHAKEAEIIAQAGRPGSVTIATNMAGRGTDIMLGGNPDMLINEELKKNPNKDINIIKEEVLATIASDKEKVLAAGGLYVLGTERHESRRIDDQLRGRSGRQGDPGKTKFYLSLEDDLMRIFGSEKISSMLTKLGLKEGEAIIHPWISRSIEKAQQRVEARNYEIRKNLLKFDDVMSEQRSVIYEQRLDLMKSEKLSSFVKELIVEINGSLVEKFIPKKSISEEWDLDSFEKEVFRIYGLHLSIKDFASREGVANEEILDFLEEQVFSAYQDKVNKYGQESMQYAQKHIMLVTLDHLWKDHLHMLDHLRTGINLRAYGQKDPLNEYKIEAFKLFQTMLDDYNILIVQRIFQLHIQDASELEQHSSEAKMIESRNAPSIEQSRDFSGERDPSNPETWGKVSRNEPCPCGSGKKYKQCHGAIT